jgi:hypothetical protein
MMKPHLFLAPDSCPPEKRKAPEVLTDVALLCVESEHNLHREVNIKPISNS